MIGVTGRLSAALAVALLAVLLQVAGPSARPVASASATEATSATSALPPGLRAAIPAATRPGKAFGLARHDGDLVAWGQGLETTFARSGPVVAHGDRSGLGLVVAGVGRGSTLGRLPEATPAATGKQVSYTRGDVVEWYRSTARGLEQGFTIRKVPSGLPSTPLTVSIDVVGPLVPRLTSGAVEFAPSRSAEPSLRYGGLFAFDATGRRLDAELALRDRTILLRVSDLGARYPLTIDPLIQPGVRLTANNAEGNALFGQGVSLSADGSTALVGAPHETAGDGLGAVWVFTRSGLDWTQSAKIQPTDETDGSRAILFGESVALSADGNTALIGEPSAVPLGRAWVFTRSGSQWVQEGPTLKPSDGVGGPQFGHSVRLSADGNTAVVGGQVDDFSHGAVWVFTRSGTTWTQQGPKLTPTPRSPTIYFGEEVAISGDGGTLLVSSNVGAWPFTWSGSAWTQQGTVLVGAVSNPSVASVALSNDGSTALVGHTFDSASLGAVAVFTRNDGVWAPQASKLTSGLTTTARFGSAVALTADGNTALIGARSASNTRGAAYVFTRSGSAWAVQGAALTPQSPFGARSEFGTSVALSATGDFALIGAPLDTPSDNSGIGAAWIFTTGAAVPGAPTGVVGNPADGRVTLTFSPPASTGGSALTSYTVTRSPGGATTIWPAPATEITVTGLTNGVAYTFTIKARNVVGFGPDSEPSAPVTPQVLTLPGPPTAVTADPGDGAATVAFTPPAVGGAISSYTVTASPGGQTGTGAASPIVVGGLANGTSYSFSVTATNTIGTGPASQASSPVTPVGVPGAPASVTAFAGDGQAVVTFAAPGSDGGSPIAFYTATASPGGQSASGAGSPITVTGLTNGESYTFAVTATNGRGLGPSSAASPAVAPAASPGRLHPDPPTGLTRPDGPEFDTPSGPRPPVPEH